jgi:tripartite-type tricarboxylate transporter receptor subunit TctC
LVVAFAQGGPTDVMARAIAERLGRSLGQPVVVENRLGGNGVDGTLAVARSPPDGYTLLLGDTVTHGINPNLLRATGYDPHNDFEPVGLLGSAHLAFVVPSSSAATSGSELMAVLRRDPQKATYASSGRGSLSHLVAEHFAWSAGIRLIPVTFAGEGPAMHGLLSGQASLHFSAFSPAVGQAGRGTLRIIAVTGTKRSTLLPSVATLAESGLGGFEAVRNYGLLAPAGTPRPIIDKVNAALRTLLADAAVRAKLAPFGIEPVDTTPDAHAKLIDREIAKWTRIMWRAGIDPSR